MKCLGPLLEDKSTITTSLICYRSSHFGATTFWPLRVTYISLMFAFAVCYTCCSCAGILGNAKGIVGWFNSASIGAPFSGLQFGLLCKAYLCLSCPGLQFALSIDVACCSDCWNHLQLGPHMISVCGDA